jgi:hypothetical protein
MGNRKIAQLRICSRCVRRKQHHNLDQSQAGSRPSNVRPAIVDCLAWLLQMIRCEFREGPLPNRHARFRPHKCACSAHFLFTSVSISYRRAFVE